MGRQPREGNCLEPKFRASRPEQSRKLKQLHKSTASTGNAPFRIPEGVAPLPKPAAPLPKQAVVPKKVPLSDTSATEDDILCRPCGDAFYSGDGKWPVDPQHLREFCGEAKGLARVANKERWNHRESHVVLGDKELIPETHTFHRRFSCLQRHPGLCITKDALIYERALQCSKNLERWCCHFNAEHRFVRVAGNEDAAQLILYVAGRRARRPFAPQAWVFALCSFSDGPEAGEIMVGFRTKTPRPWRVLSRRLKRR